MTGYTVREVAEMLGLSRAQIRLWAAAGVLTPGKGPRGELRFSFQDLVLLRTAAGLRAARISPLRVRRALKKLLTQLPTGRSLTAVRITAVGDRIVVQDGGTPWDPDSGQVLFDFAVADLARRVEPLARKAAEVAMSEGGEWSADQWYELGCELEIATPADAREAYFRALAIDPTHADAHVNLGRLLHETGDLREAARHYRLAIEAGPDDSIAHFNLGVALEDEGKFDEAGRSYERAIELDEKNADAHFNLAGLRERSGQLDAAFRHLKRYKKLVE